MTANENPAMRGHSGVSKKLGGFQRSEEPDQDTLERSYSQAPRQAFVSPLSLPFAPSLDDVSRLERQAHVQVRVALLLRGGDRLQGLALAKALTGAARSARAKIGGAP